MEKTSVLLVDDHSNIRQGMRALLECEADLEVLAEAENGREAVQLAQENKPDVVVMNLSMPDMNGAEATRQLLRSCPSTKVLVVTSSANDECLAELHNAGAVGYLVRQTAAVELPKAIRKAHESKSGLSPSVSKPFRDENRSSPILPVQRQNQSTGVWPKRETLAWPLIDVGSIGGRERGKGKEKKETLRARLKAIVPLQLRRAVRRLLPKRGYIRYQGCMLPPREFRSRMCGSIYCDDDYFFKSGVAEARRFVERLGCKRDSRVVDIGCGAGRLAIGLVQEVDGVSYCGLDAYKPFVDWCRRHIERDHPSFRFIHVDVENERYNPNGAKVTKDFLFPLADGQADIVYLWGLFTNLAPDDMLIYVREISRVARQGARVFLTGFVEERVPAVALNPTDYVDYKCDGPLCVVRYEKNFLFDIFAEHGLSVDEFAYHAGAHSMQSEIYLKKRESD